MDLDEVVDLVAGWDGVLVLRPGPGDGSPEISWGDVLVYVAPDGRVPSGQPFATIVTEDYPGEPGSGPDRPGSFRANIAAREPRRGGAGQGSSADPPGGGGSPTRASGPGEPAEDPRVEDALMPHPSYGQLGWGCVADPGRRSGEQVKALLETAHAAASARWQHRHETPRTSDPHRLHRGTGR